MKIAILLPYKENFSPIYAGAVSLFVKDTIKLSEEKIFDKLEIISVAEVFGESIKRIVEGTSLSSLFRGFN